MSWRKDAEVEQRGWMQGVIAAIKGRDNCKKSEIAAALGVSVATLWRWEQAETAPELEPWLRIRALISGRAVVRRGRFVEL